MNAEAARMIAEAFIATQEMWGFVTNSSKHARVRVGRIPRRSTSSCARQREARATEG